MSRRFIDQLGAALFVFAVMVLFVVFARSVTGGAPVPPGAPPKVLTVPLVAGTWGYAF